MSHAERARAFSRDAARARWHDEALWYVREKRDRAARAVPEWEELRERAAAIKAHALSHLDRYLEEFEARATDHGIQVHWARDAAEHNRIVHGILAARRARRVVKSKSMLTEECGLNPYLAAREIEVVDTDLGERIVQLRREPPSHIVFPAIHLRRAEIGELFHRELGGEAGAREPEYLVRLARVHLRERFLRAEAAITGVNFAIAETCPVYRRSGGTSYGAVVPGPIGSVLAPGSDLARHASLPFASTLCGSCSDVCPVKIDLHGQLLAWRREVRSAGAAPGPGRFALRAARAILTRPRLYRLLGSWLRALGRLPRPLLYGAWNTWGRGRELPVPPERSFREALRRRERGRARR